MRQAAGSLSMKRQLRALCAEASRVGALAVAGSRQLIVDGYERVMFFLDEACMHQVDMMLLRSQGFVCAAGSFGQGVHAPE